MALLICTSSVEVLVDTDLGSKEPHFVSSYELHIQFPKTYPEFSGCSRDAVSCSLLPKLHTVLGTVTNQCSI